MINEINAISMIEAKDIIENLEREEKREERNELIGYLKKFVKIKSEDAKKLKKEIQALDMLKIKPEHIAKIIDIMPEDISDLNKIFSDVDLNENELNKILEIVKKYK